VVTPARAVVAGIVAAAALTAALIALLGGRSAHVVPPHDGIGVSGDISPRSALFGDPLTAQAVVVVDRRVVDAGSLRLDGTFGSYVTSTPPHVTRTDDGPVTRIVYRYRLQCLTGNCLPSDPSTTHGLRVFGLAPLRLSFKQRDGTPGAMLVRWPLINVASRMSGIDMALLTPIDQPPFHATMSLPPASYAISPALLVALLAAGAALLLAASGVLVYRFVRVAPAPVVAEPVPVRPAEPVRILSPLERALHLLERARERGAVPEQRKALENLAGELRRTGERELALSASVLAWAEWPPGTDATGALAAAVQRRIAKGVNGHGAEA
jgi:hypothetical protein